METNGRPVAYLPWILRILALITVAGGAMAMSWDIGLGVHIAVTAFAMILVASVLDETSQPGEVPPLGCGGKAGCLLYFLGFFLLLPGKVAPAFFLIFLAFLLARSAPLAWAYRWIHRKLTTLDPEWWVGFAGGVIMLFGGVIFIVGALGSLKFLKVTMTGLNVAVGTAEQTEDYHRLIDSLGATGLGFALLTVGIGIRRRAVWAGLLGLCFTFYSLVQAIQATILATHGDHRRLPAAIIANSLSLFMNWAFFFGFYSIFTPLIAGRARELAGALEDQLRSAREALAAAETNAARASKSLEDERSKFAALIEASNEGIALLDPPGNLLYVNPAFAALYDLGEADWRGKPWAAIFQRPFIQVHARGPAEPPPTSPSEEVPAASPRPAPATTVVPAGGEATLLDRQGAVKRRLAFYTKPVRDAAGACVAIMGMSRDVTLEKEIDQMKTEFVSNVSHELRTPLTSIRAYTEMLLDGEMADPKTAHEYLEVILGESERLTNLINDILDLSKMEAGKRIYKFASGSPAAILEKVGTICRADAARKQLEFSLVLPDTSRAAVFDPDLLHQAVLNLVNNAIKYTPEGGRIEAGLEFGASTYRIWVSDTGQGISEEDQKKLFAKFFRVENSLNREIGGTGLGLALVRQIVLVHQGEVSLESAPGKGARFSLDLPYVITKTDSGEK